MGYLRLLLAVSVIYAHSEPASGVTLLPGNMAVEIFFMISGFYMSLVLAGKYEPRTPGGILAFYTSRFLRLWPTFLVTTLAYHLLWFASFLYLGREPTSAGPIHGMIGNAGVSALLRLSNHIMIGQDIPCLFHASYATGARFTLGPGIALADGSPWVGNALIIGPAWSIGAEIWFYLLAPFLVRLPSRVLLAFLIAGLLLRYVLAEVYGLNVYFFFPTQLPLFLAGMLAYRMGPPRDAAGRRRGAILCLGAVLTACALFGSLGQLGQQWKWLLYLAAGLTMNALFVYTERDRLGRTIGELSYPVYITHMLLLSLLGIAGKRLGFEATSEVLLLTVLPVSYLIFVFIEKPAGRWRERLAARMQAGVCERGQAWVAP